MTKSDPFITLAIYTSCTLRGHAGKIRKKLFGIVINVALSGVFLLCDDQRNLDFRKKLTIKIWLGAASVVGAHYVFYVEISPAQDLRPLIVKVCNSFCGIDKQEI